MGIVDCSVNQSVCLFAGQISVLFSIVETETCLKHTCYASCVFLGCWVSDPSKNIMINRRDFTVFNIGLLCLCIKGFI